MVNTPYVKIYKDGVLTNPIEKQYNSGRSQRKIKRGLERFIDFSYIGIIRHEIKSKRGYWLLKNFINLNK